MGIIGTFFVGAWGILGAHDFALLVSSHDGGPGQDRLKFAQEDAERLKSVLVELGGFEASMGCATGPLRRGVLKRLPLGMSMTTG